MFLSDVNSKENNKLLEIDYETFDDKANISSV